MSASFTSLPRHMQLPPLATERNRVVVSAGSLPAAATPIARAQGLDVDSAMRSRQTVLVVDDDADNRLLLNEIMRGQCRVIEAASGAEALAIASSEPRIDLILLDVMMPGMSGYEVLERLRADVRTADTAVIFITGYDDEKEEEKGLSLGAVDYVVKPIRPAIVRARLSNQLRLIAQRQQMSILLGHDALTGIANRRGFDQALELMRDVSSRSGQSFGLALIDIDFFKQYNDSFGHPAGDVALRQVAAVIARHASAPHQLAARYGGEEFALLMPDAGVLGETIESIRLAVLDLRLDHPYAAWGFLSISAGAIATHAEADTTTQGLLARADALLYQAKRSGRNRVLTRLDSF